jgi:hypothetical protein
VEVKNSMVFHSMLRECAPSISTTGTLIHSLAWYSLYLLPAELLLLFYPLTSDFQSVIKRFCIVLLLVFPFAVSALTAEQAYAAIPHQRTVFDTMGSRLPTEQADALDKLFLLLDRAIVLRVDALSALKRGDAAHLQANVVEYPALIAAMRALRLTPQTQAATSLIIQAVQQHQAFFNSKLADGSRLDSGFTADVSQSSQNLHQAYSLLMRTFPEETPHNRQAFFDYLCALDFL